MRVIAGMTFELNLDNNRAVDAECTLHKLQDVLRNIDRGLRPDNIKLAVRLFLPVPFASNVTISLLVSRKREVT